jgi:hypothetical protein
LGEELFDLIREVSRNIFVCGFLSFVVHDSSSPLVTDSMTVVAMDDNGPGEPVAMSWGEMRQNLGEVGSRWDNERGQDCFSHGW